MASRRQASALVLFTIAVIIKSVTAGMIPDAPQLNVSESTDCYGDLSNLTCPPGSRFAPVAYIYAIKPPDFLTQHQCLTSSKLPKDCCQVGDMDCKFQSQEYFGQIVQSCTGLRSCVLSTPRIETRSKLNERFGCGYTNRSDIGGILTTQYVTKQYVCVPEADIQPICSSGTHSGQFLHISSYLFNTGLGFVQNAYECTCRVKKVNANRQSDVISVKSIDLRLCSDTSSPCNQSLTFIVNGNKPFTIQQTSNDDNGSLALKEVFSSSQNEFSVTLKITDPKQEYKVWLYIEGNGAALQVDCGNFSSDETETPVIALVNADGSAASVTEFTGCFGDFYNLECPNRHHIAPIAYIYGLKPPDLQDRYNCSSRKSYAVPFPRPCCVINTTTDCLIKNNKDFHILVNACAMETICPQRRVDWMTLYRSSPDDCRYIERSEASFQMATQYTTTRYACIPDREFQPLCDRVESHHAGKSLHISMSEDGSKGGYQCKCRISRLDKTRRSQKIFVQAIDIRLCLSPAGCDQSLTFNDSIQPAFPITKTANDDDGGWLALKDVYSTEGSEFFLTLQNAHQGGGYRVWLYVYAGGDDLGVICRQASYGESLLPLTLPVGITVPTPAPTTHNPGTPSVTGLGRGQSPVPANRKSTSQSAGASLPVSADSQEDLVRYGSIAGGCVGFLILLICGVFLRIKYKRRSLEHAVVKRRQRMSTSWLTGMNQNSRIGSGSNLLSDVDSAFESCSVFSITTTNIQPCDSVSQVAARTKLPTNNQNSSRQQLLKLLREKIHQNPELEALILAIPESQYEMAPSSSSRDAGGKETKAVRRINEVLECFSTETLLQTLYEFYHGSQALKSQADGNLMTSL